jgi:hypothetical protein
MAVLLQKEKAMCACIIDPTLLGKIMLFLPFYPENYDDAQALVFVFVGA